MIVKEVGEHSIQTTLVGSLFFKHLMFKAVIDTAVISAQLQENLINIPNYMLQVNSNIEQFNQWVKFKRQSLLARSEEVGNIMTHLFSGYQQAQDCNFWECISDKKVGFEEGQQIAPDALMTYALNYYYNHKNWKV
eukprot:11651853-Ditylum_brightwellii.AAC.1